MTRLKKKKSEKKGFHNAQTSNYSHSCVTCCELGGAYFWPINWFEMGNSKVTPGDKPYRIAAGYYAEIYLLEHFR